MVQRLFFNILSDDVAASKEFYIDLLDLKIHFDSDWFVILKPDGDTSFEFGIVDRYQEIIPAQERKSPAGAYPCFVVENVERIHKTAEQMGAEIIEPPRDMSYGQRRMLVRDPDGSMIDISSPTVARPD